MKAEKTYENKLKAFLKKRGVYHVKYFGCAFTQAGVPDLLACVNGTFLGIEVKASTGKPSTLQLANLRLIDAAGGIALLTYPEDYEDVKILINALIDRKPVAPLYEPFRWRFM